MYPTQAIHFIMGYVTAGPSDNGAKLQVGKSGIGLLQIMYWKAFATWHITSLMCHMYP